MQPLHLQQQKHRTLRPIHSKYGAIVECVKKRLKKQLKLKESKKQSGTGLARGVNLSVAVYENEKDGVVFLYKIVEGGVDKSYGIEVAKLAGLPTDLISRAQQVLQDLEKKKVKKGTTNPDQMAMFAGSQDRVAGSIKSKKKARRWIN